MVVHFGAALNGVDFNKMDGQLSVIVSEMGQAQETDRSSSNVEIGLILPRIA